MSDTPAPTASAATESVTVAFRDGNNREIHLKLSPDKELKLAFRYFLNWLVRNGAMPQSSVEDMVFYYNGERLQDTDTARSRDIVDGSYIDAHLRQKAGQ
eukprot:TRINITY_DN2196_c0_g1_i1.p1 TRINITY_DN2196_c0_g1~~TRINITY_DN2196_c0_g1_i1.p1  ORF type:complete len:100 (-),score=22.19 TRINITY_DN2196_c0_g1_i1:91-390(-)